MGTPLEGQGTKYRDVHFVLGGKTSKNPVGFGQVEYGPVIFVKAPSNVAV